MGSMLSRGHPHRGLVGEGGRPGLEVHCRRRGSWGRPQKGVGLWGRTGLIGHRRHGAWGRPQRCLGGGQQETVPVFVLVDKNCKEKLNVT